MNSKFGLIRCRFAVFIEIDLAATYFWTECLSNSRPAIQAVCIKTILEIFPSSRGPWGAAMQPLHSYGPVRGQFTRKAKIYEIKYLYNCVYTLELSTIS